MLVSEAQRQRAWTNARERALQLLQRDGPPDEPRDTSGKWTDGGGDGGSSESGFMELPPMPGTASIPEDHVRLYHQTTEEKLETIRQNGITVESAKGIEGPKAVYADEKGFYGDPAHVPSVEFHVPKERWDPPFVRTDSDLDNGRVAPENIVAIHYPWHARARYIEDNPKVLAAVLAGEHDDLMHDKDYARPIQYIKDKYGKSKKSFRQIIIKFDPDEPRDESGKWTDGGGSDDIETTHESKPDGGYKSQLFHQLKGGAGAFHKAISEAKAASPHGAAVELHSAEQYEGMRTFLTPDKKAGFAIDGDNIVSVFKHPDSKAQGIAKSALTLATKLGGRRLDAFDTNLPHMYSNAGFRAVARLPFDEKYAPEGWSKETFGKFNGGKPDVVFMVHDPDRASHYKPGDGKAVSTYDEGIKAQQDALAERDRVASVVARVPGAKEAIATARAKLATGIESKPASGVYSVERQEVHKQILGDIFTPERIAAATPAKGEQPVLHLMGGAGGSGKSYFSRAGHVPMDKALYLNADDMKAALPEYQGWNAALLHEESSDLLRTAENNAKQAGLNVILDGTMGNMAVLDKRVDDYKSAGYRVAGHFMRVTPETSAKRALERFVRGGATGRFVPPELLLKHDATANFEKARGKMDSWEMYDNEGKAPVKVDSSEERKEFRRFIAAVCAARSGRAANH